MRQIIIVVAGVAILGIGFFLKNTLAESKKKPELKTEAVVKTAFVEIVKNKTIPVVISESGNLEATNKVTIFSEVQGVLLATGKDFKPGVVYTKGQTLLRINSDEHSATLRAQRSSLQNLIASILPDLQLDYPASFEAWSTYLKCFDVNSIVGVLPEPVSDKEKYFITGRNIYSTYYAIKNLESRLFKYNLKAPFTGVLTETLVTDGTLVRVGQKMGEFIDPSSYEMAITVNASQVQYLKVGKEVTLQNTNATQKWIGKVTRINGKIDPKTQTVTLYVQVTGNNLREGMFLEANVPINNVDEAYQVSRKLLINNKFIYIVVNNELELQPVDVVHFNEKTAIIKGLKDGMSLVNKSITGAYNGMTVKVYADQQPVTK